MTWTVQIHPRVDKFIDKHLTPEDKVRVLALFDQLAVHGTNLKKPYTRQIERDLWELRPQTARGTWRFLYFYVPVRRFCIVVGMRKGRITKEVKRTARGRLAYFEERA